MSNTGFATCSSDFPLFLILKLAGAASANCEVCGNQHVCILRGKHILGPQVT